MPDSMIAFTVHKQAGRKCPWCDKAVALLDEKGMKYSLRVHSLTDIKAVAERAKMNTVPIIYHGVKLIGGHDDLVEYLSD